jgi:putative peptidoglycan lipid II flippase
MLALSGLLIGGTAGQVISTAFYAVGDTWRPTMLFIATYTVYVPLKILVFLRWGVIGIAVAASVHLVLNFLVQLSVLEITITRRRTSTITAAI